MSSLVQVTGSAMEEEALVIDDPTVILVATVIGEYVARNSFTNSETRRPTPYFAALKILQNMKYEVTSIENGSFSSLVWQAIGGADDEPESENKGRISQSEEQLLIWLSG